MKLSFTFLALLMLSLSASQAYAGKKTANQAEEPSLGLQVAKRVVRSQQVADRIPARAYGWGSWMVQKYKKSAMYQNEQKPLSN